MTEDAGTMWIGADELPEMVGAVFKLWPMMEHRAEHETMLARRTSEIVAAFCASKTADDALGNLLKIDGMCPMLATGLIWSYCHHCYIPMDRWTMGLLLMEEIAPSSDLAHGYMDLCDRVFSHMDEKGIDEPEDFVKMAGDVVPEEYTREPAYHA